MAQPVVLRDVWKTYGAREVLRGVELTVPQGEMVTITGRSGSGKSTLVKLLAGLDTPTRGEVLVDGIDVAAASDREVSELRLRHIGLVFQSFNLIPDLTVAKNVALPLQLAEVPRADAQARVKDLLKLVGLSQHQDARPSTLSGGEQQRAAIARALANRPALLLADEPTSSLDAENALNVLQALEDVNRAVGTTIVLVSHDDLVTQRVPNRLVLQDGRLVASAGRASMKPRA